MKIKFDDLTEFQQWILVSGLNKDKNLESFWNSKGLHQNIDIYINGHKTKFDFLDSINSIEKQLDRLILKKAQDLLNDKLSDLLTTIYNAQESIAEFLPEYYKE